MDSLAFLKPEHVGQEVFMLPSGEQVHVATYSIRFHAWTGVPVKNSYGNKTVVEQNGEAVFAELAVLRMFQENGWDGVWVDSFGRKYRTGMHEMAAPVDLPAEKSKIIETIQLTSGTSGGCWDVFVWNDNHFLFVELKRKQKDKIRPAQVRWLESAISLGYPLSNFALVEWDVLTSPPCPRRPRDVLNTSGISCPTRHRR